MDTSAITFAAGTIHRPSEPRHFMALAPVPGTVRIHWNGFLLAESRSATRLTEVGHQIYAPVIYVPRDDVTVDLLPSDRQSHCPLKGDCSWYSVEAPDGADIAWSYETPFDFASDIKELVAFDAGRVTITEGPK